MLKAVLAYLIATTCVAHNILDFGAIQDKITHHAEVTNSMAILDAIMAAHSSENDDRVVHIPQGLWSSYPIRAENVKNITIQIDGVLILSKDFKNFPNRQPGEMDHLVEDFLSFHDCEDLKFQGSGEIDGQGFMWWMREYLQKNPFGRPNILGVTRVRNLEWTGIKVQNSPYYHLIATDIDNAYFHDFEINVDIFSQRQLGQLLGNDLGLGLSIPTFPLNTDGIDPAGSNILIERVKITNFDDAVAVKPSKKSY